MLVANFKLKSLSPLSFSKRVYKTKDANETHEQFEKRIWPERTHEKGGHVFLPGINLKKAIAATAQYLSIKIPGKANATFSKNFLQGVLCPDDLPLYHCNGRKAKPITVKDMKGVWIQADAQGQKGGRGGKQVSRCYPAIDEWKCNVTIHIADDTITKEIFEKVLIQSGILNGVGRWRSQNGGSNGRYAIDGKIQWTEI